MQRSPTLDELDSLHRAIGLGIWSLQHLEYALHILLTIKVDLKTPGNVAPGAARAALEKQARQTLGASLRTAKASAALPSALQLELEEFLIERNWLVHRSIDEHTEGMYNDQGRSDALDRLMKFIAQAEHLKHSVIQEFVAYSESKGVPVKEAERLAREKVAQLRGEA